MTDPAPAASSRPTAMVNASWFGGVVAIASGSLFMLGGVLCLQSCGQIVAQELDFLRHGASTEAEVVAHHVTVEAESPEAILTLQYAAPLPGSPSSATYRQEVSVSAERYEQLGLGKQVLIRYSRPDPTQFRLAEDPPISGLALSSFFGSFFTIVGSLHLVAGLCCFFYLVVLACRGENQHGWVVDRWEEPISDDTTNFCVSYRFLTASGDQQLAAEVNRRAFHQLRPGSPVKVRAVRGRPEIRQLQL